jgi:hypothetical protein
MLNVSMLNVVLLSVILHSIITLSVFMLRVIMLSVVLPGVVLTDVVAPTKIRSQTHRKHSLFEETNRIETKLNGEHLKKNLAYHSKFFFSRKI